jgi:hypothetical protein
MARRSDSGVRDDEILPFTRGLGWVIAPFLVLAFFVLFPWPRDTDRLFAWHIKPTMTAMTLGSAYLGGAYYFVRVGLARHWHAIKAGFVPVAVFAALLGIATIAHWDRFHHDHVAFWLWVGLYFTTPFLVAWSWVRNRVRDDPGLQAEPELPAPVANTIGTVGVLAVATGALLFAAPGRAIAIWPWALTPLTARVVGAVFCLGLAGIGTFVDRRWSSARIPCQVALVMLVLLLIAGVRGHDEFDATNVLTWLFALGFPLAAIMLAVTYLRMERRRSARANGTP